MLVFSEYSVDGLLFVGFELGTKTESISMIMIVKHIFKHSLLASGYKEVPFIDDLKRVEDPLFFRLCLQRIIDIFRVFSRSGIFNFNLKETYIRSSK